MCLLPPMQISLSVMYIYIHKCVHNIAIYYYIINVAFFARCNLSYHLFILFIFFKPRPAVLLYIIDPLFDIDEKTILSYIRLWRAMITHNNILYTSRVYLFCAIQYI